MSFSSPSWLLRYNDMNDSQFALNNLHCILIYHYTGCSLFLNIFYSNAFDRIQFADPVAVRHALGLISDIATKDPYSVAMALGQFKFSMTLHLHW